MVVGVVVVLVVTVTSVNSSGSEQNEHLCARCLAKSLEKLFPVNSVR